MLQSFALSALVLSGRVTLEWIVGLSVVQGLVNAFDLPTRQAFLLTMIEKKEDLGNAIALNSSMVNLARLIGPSIAGVVIALAGEGWCFLIDGVSYVAVIVGLLRMRIVRRELALPVRRDTRRQLIEGFTCSPCPRVSFSLLDNQRLFMFELGAATEDFGQGHEDERDEDERQIEMDSRRDGEAAAGRQSAPHGGGRRQLGHGIEPRNRQQQHAERSDPHDVLRIKRRPISNALKDTSEIVEKEQHQSAQDCRIAPEQRNERPRQRWDRQPQLSAYVIQQEWRLTPYRLHRRLQRWRLHRQVQAVIETPIRPGEYLDQEQGDEHEDRKGPEDEVGK